MIDKLVKIADLIERDSATVVESESTPVLAVSDFDAAGIRLLEMMVQPEFLKRIEPDGSDVTVGALLEVLMRAHWWLYHAEKTTLAAEAILEAAHSEQERYEQWLNGDDQAGNRGPK